MTTTKLHCPAFALTLARHPDDPATLAFAGVIAQSLRARRQPLIRGLNEDGFRNLLNTFFPGLDCPNGTTRDDPLKLFEYDEFDDIVALLLSHRAYGEEMESWLAHAIATASMGENHLWQDMGLPNRTVLSALMQKHFPSLAALNDQDMKWKKFFYRQLCELAGVLICKSPRCAECCDYRICFGPEDA
ncbi:MAG: nitrogen fixation protein NifQ [Propionivibrio sp.]|jgi:nitrogen fixation protein NifQ|nr:nitrogen fixation protein NifQ [Propionivibrio sp.]MBP6711333.1 nitrogen fixation protein NifQ [Propionivibrio sp.]MBP7523890.1 nitrogen fixation protein NifQ [Propionivibrio sp.]MBP8162204.1 nitrogen fixation protein NifQ [Propionivibrio sp.]